MRLLKLLLFFNLFFAIASCADPKLIYSGKIINQKNLENLNISNKEELLQNLGQPSFIDPIENKFFYYSEKNKENYSKRFNRKNIWRCRDSKSPYHRLIILIVLLKPKVIKPQYL